jgi:hypothetical protein
LNGMFKTSFIMGVVLCGMLASAQRTAITVFGEVSDSQCAFAVHSNTGSHDEVLKSGLFGRTAADCVRACVRFGGKYVLVDGAKKKVYQIDNPDKLSPYAAEQVRVRGTLDEKGVLHVEEIELRNPASDKGAKK